MRANVECIVQQLTILTNLIKSIRKLYLAMKSTNKIGIQDEQISEKRNVYHLYQTRRISYKHFQETAFEGSRTLEK